ncbi:MAG: hypothetical protein E7491_03550 [Ruminococcaceae bacterium]|nr:hypothetical protein [Oscillospiraceae bacterium]
MKKMSIFAAVFIVIFCTLTGCGTENGDQLKNEAVSLDKFMFVGEDMLWRWNVNGFSYVIAVSSPKIGREAVLCTEAGCEHTSSSCTARLADDSNYSMDRVFLYKDKLHIIAASYVDNETIIYRSNKDGTGRKVLCKIPYGRGVGDINGAVLKDNELWLACSVFDPLKDDVFAYSLSIVCVDLSNGKYNNVYEFEEKPKSGQIFHVLEMEMAGDIIYCRYGDGALLDEKYFLNTKTGEVKKATLPNGDAVNTVYEAYGNIMICASGENVYALDVERKVETMLIEGVSAFNKLTVDNKFYFNETIKTHFNKKLEYEKCFNMSTGQIESTNASVTSGNGEDIGFLGETGEWIFWNFYKDGKNRICFSEKEKFLQGNAQTTDIGWINELKEDDTVLSPTPIAKDKTELEKSLPTLEQVNEMFTGAVFYNDGSLEKYSENAYLFAVDFGAYATDFEKTTDLVSYYRQDEQGLHIFNAYGLFDGNNKENYEVTETGGQLGAPTELGALGVLSSFRSYFDKLSYLRDGVEMGRPVKVYYCDISESQGDGTIKEVRYIFHIDMEYGIALYMNKSVEGGSISKLTVENIEFNQVTDENIFDIESYKKWQRENSKEEYLPKK